MSEQNTNYKSKTAEQPQTRTITSVLIMNQDCVYLKQTDWGLSLLGGSIDFRYGVVDGLRRNIFKDHAINLPHKLALNGIYQHGYQDKTWRTNINFCINPRDLPAGEKEKLETLVQIPINRALSGVKFRTPEVRSAIIDNYQQPEGIPILKHSFHYTSAREFASGNLEYQRHYNARSAESTIVSAVIQNQFGEILMLRVPNNGSGGYIDSLPGGRVRPGELLHEALMRELTFKLDTTIKPIGILCVYVNRLKENEYVTNFCMYARAQKESIFPVPSDIAAKKVVDRRWVSMEKLQQLNAKRSLLLRNMRRDANYVINNLDDELAALAVFDDASIAMEYADKTPQWGAKSVRRYLLPIDCVSSVDMPMSARKIVIQSKPRM